MVDCASLALRAPAGRLSRCARLSCRMPRSRTPAAPREPDQNGSSVLTSSTLTLWSTALISLTRPNRLGKVRLPYGLRHSLCTLHLFRSACLHQPVRTGVQSANPTEAQHSIRAAGQALPDRDFHPARSTKLCLAHQHRGVRRRALRRPHQPFVLVWIPLWSM